MDELGIIKRTMAIMGRSDDNLLGYDDASAIKVNGNVLVVNVDSFDEKTDWLPGMRPSDAGWKAVVMSVSDVLVKGGDPKGILLSMGIPERFSDEALEDIIGGMKEAIDAYDLGFWGGDTSTSVEDFYISVICMGFARKLIPRSGAKPGDILFSTGAFGLTSMAYMFLLKGFPPPDKWKEVLRAAYRPTLVDPKSWLSLAPFITASIDSSDGLALSLHYLSQSSNVKILVEDVPIHRDLVEYAGERGLDPLRIALYRGGEEFVFLFTTPPEYEGRVLDLARERGIQVFRLGRIERGKGVWMKLGGKVVGVEPGGWVHGRGWDLLEGSDSRRIH